jgi:hypothetical protein
VSEKLETFIEEMANLLKDKKGEERKNIIFNKIKELTREGLNDIKIRIKNRPKINYLASLLQKNHHNK